MKNCTNKNALPMKWLMINLFHGGHYEHSFSHIGMGRRNLEFFARIYPTDRSYFHQPAHRLDTVHHPPNHLRYYAVCRTKRQASARCLPSPVSKVPLESGSLVETVGTTAHRTVLSCRLCVDGYGRYHLSPHRSRGRWRRMVARCAPLDRLPSGSLLGTEPCGADPASNPSLGRRAAGTSYQYEIASQKRPRSYRTCPANACGSKELVSGKTGYNGGGRRLRHTGRLWYDIYPPYQSNAARCGHLRIAQKETETSTWSQTKTRQAAGNPDTDSFPRKILASCKNKGTRKNQIPIGVYQGRNMVQGFSCSGIAGNKPRPRGQGKRRLFLYNRSATGSRRGHRRFCGSLEHRGYFQEYQAVPGKRATTDVERPGAGACGSAQSVAVFGGLGVVYPVWLRENQPVHHAVVFLQNLSELPGCVGRVAAGAVAETNCYNVRQSYRTCTNYRVLYQSRIFGCIINYEKCES